MAGGGKYPFNINCTVQFFSGYQVEERGQKWCEGGNGCMYIKDCFTPIFPLFLMRLLRKLKLLIPLVGLSPPNPPTPTHVLVLLAKLRLWTNESTFSAYSVAIFKTKCFTYSPAHVTYCTSRPSCPLQFHHHNNIRTITESKQLACGVNHPLL